MRQNTRVGGGRVDLTIDGSGLNEEIVKSVDAAGDDIEEAGDDHGRRYGDSFSERFRERLDKSRARIASTLSDRLGQAGEDAGDQTGTRFSKALGDRLASRPDAVRRGIHSAFGDDDFIDRIGEHFADRMSTSLGDRIESALAHQTTEFEDIFDRLGERAGRSMSQGIARTVSRNESLGDRLFSGRPRNNFLNAIFIGMKLITNLTEGAFKIVPKAFNALESSMAGAGDEAFSFSRLMSSAGSGVMALVSSLPALAVTIIAVVTGASVLVSVLSALLAIVVALASTIISALVGAVLVGAGAFLAMGAAAGLAVVAFTSMTNAQSALLSSAMRPLHQEAVGLGQTILTDLVPAFADWSHNLQVALALAQPLAAVMGGALADAGRIFTASLSGPGVQLLLAALSVTLPGIIEHLSSALGGFVNGLAGMFAAIMPYVLQFSIYLDNVANRFAKWASSAAGQNAIVEFVGRALVALGSLWNFVTAIGSLLAYVFFDKRSQQTGNNIFDRMAAAVRRFTDYLSKDDRLDRWLAQGWTFALALGEAITTIGQVTADLNSAGVIAGIGDLVHAFSVLYGWLSKSVPLLAVALQLLGEAKGATSGDINSLAGLLGENMGLVPDAAGNLPVPATQVQLPTLPNLDDVIGGLTSSGADALANTYASNGGYMPDPTKDKPKKPPYKNPYLDLANSLIQQAPTVKHQINAAVKSMNKALQDAVSGAATAVGAQAVNDAFSAQADALHSQANSLVQNAKSALSSAAQTLAGATNKKDAKAALKDVQAMQANLALAIAAQDKLDAAAKILNSQKVLTESNVTALIAGQQINATLADFAEARSRVAEMLTNANQKLLDAIALRDNYAKSVSDAAKSFASILTAEAKTINGIQQALTADDITTNLQARLDKLRKFQDGLRILLARGLSDAAYKQLVDAGVDQGSAYVDALVKGGQGAIGQTNSLVAQIGAVSDQLGLETSSRLYQAGVDAAQGLVDGLLSLSAQLDSAAAQLGASIAAAVKRELGIASPSTVMLAVADNVGDTLAYGLDAQHVKVNNASARLASQVAISPGLAAAYAEGRVPGGVSGNGNPRFRDLHVHTPTEDPMGVAHEVFNEVTGRL